jgi:hypothetical protein
MLVTVHPGMTVFCIVYAVHVLVVAVGHVPAVATADA